MKTPAIFISHSTRDDDFGHQLLRDLRQALGQEIQIWYDNAGGLTPGSRWWETIMNAVQNCTHFIVILSPDASESPWVNDEITMAWQQRIHDGKWIIPIMYRQCEIRPDLAMRQVISFVDAAEYSQSLTQLCSVLAQPPQPLMSHWAPARASSEPSSAAWHTETLPMQTEMPLAGTSPPPQHPAAPPLRQAQMQIMMLNGDSPQRMVPITQDIFTLGQAPTNDIVLHDPAVAAHHAILTVTGGQWQIRSHNNQYPLYVNGHVCFNTLLRTGDQLVLGGTLLRFIAGNSMAVGGEKTALTLSSVPIFPSLLVDSPHCHFRAPLREPVIVLGRQPDCGLIIPSPVVSRLQAVIKRLSNGGYIIANSATHNPLFYHEHPLLQHDLSEGDTFTIGEATRSVVHLRFSLYTQPDDLF